MIINIRGTNGAGKSYVAKHFLDHQCTVDLVQYKDERGKDQAVLGHIKSHICANGATFKIATVGSYRKADGSLAGAGGMDKISNFNLAFRAIDFAAQIAEHVLCEGIMASTVYGSWAEFASNKGSEFAFAYLRPSLEICVERVKKRQREAGREKPFNIDLMKNKIRSVESSRLKAIRDGHRVYDLPLDYPAAAIELILQGKGEVWRAGSARVR